MAQSRAAAAATPVRNIRDRFLFMKLLLKKVWMDQTASRLHPLYSSQMVLRTTQALTANMAQDMGW